MVTSVPVDASYDFPRTELPAMSNNIAQLIDRLDLHRRNMMEELKVLRDVTLFYNEQHPELRAAETSPIAEDNQDGSSRQHDTAKGAKTSTPEKQKNSEDKETKKKGAAAYQLGNTSSRTITEVKQR